MAKLSGQQIADLIAKNGKWAPPDNDPRAADFYDTAVAVALAESRGDTNAKNPSSSASGLFQIMVSVHGDKIRGRNIFDPAVNVDVARMVYQAAGNSWSPWETYNNGEYREFLGKGAVKRSDLSPSAGDIAGNLTSAVTGPAKLVAGVTSDIMRWLAKSALVVGAALLAIILVGFGLWLIVSNTKTGKAVGEAGKSAALAAATKGLVK